MGITTMPLDEDQMHVVEAPVDCHIRVLSTPGGGKSSVLVARVCHLIDVRNEEPGCMRIMSFSRQSAAEVAARLPEGVRCSTIHSFCSALSSRLEPLFASTTACSIGPAAINDDEEASCELFSPDEFLFRLRDLLVEGRCTHENVEGIRFLFVDEMQDLCPVQFDVIRLLSELFGVRVFGVGDRNQNIYGFRSSDARFLDQMETLPGHRCMSFELKRNYRSLTPIVAFANAVVEGSKKMVAVRASSLEPVPTLTAFGNQGEELSWVVDQVKNALRRRQPGDLAVIARSRKEVFLVSHKLVERRIPNRVVINEGDSKGQGTRDPKSVSICTMHGSKGLEWPVVYLVGMNDWYIRSLLSKKEQEQEDNLVFVATTRARDELHITSSFGCVSRIISRVPHSLFAVTPSDRQHGIIKASFSTGGQEPFERTERSVSKFVQHCTGELYRQMKDDGLLPRVFPGAHMERLHAAHPFPKALEDAKPYYGSIVERVIFKQVDRQVRAKAVQAGGSTDLHDMRSPDSHANACFLFVRTDRRWDQDPVTDEELAAQKQELASTFGLTPLHVSERARKNLPAYVASKGILYAKHSDREHAKVFEQRINSVKESYRRYVRNDFDINTEDGLRVIAEVATCAHLCFAPTKTHLLFKRFTCGSLEMDSNLGLYQQADRVVSTLLEPHFKRYPPQVVVSPPEVADATYMLRTFGVATDLDVSVPSLTGICDMVVGQTVVEIKTSSEPGGVQISWMLQALLYAALARERGLDIRQIAIYNPLKGFMWTAPIHAWQNGAQLLRLVADQTSSRVSPVGRAR